MRNPSNLLALTAVALAFTSLGTARAGEVQLPGTFEIKRQKRPGNAVVVTINNVTTGRILWKQRLQAYETQDPPFNLSLSPDHQAVAVEEAFDSGNGYFLLVWRAGKGRQFLRHLRFSSSLYKHKPNLTNIRGDLLSPDCSILQISLSPDKSRLLIRVDWGMGDASIGVAELWCLGLNTGRLQVFGKWTEGDARWLTSRTISFVPASTGSMKPFREIVSVR